MGTRFTTVGETDQLNATVRDQLAHVGLRQVGHIDEEFITDFVQEYPLGVTYLATNAAAAANQGMVCVLFGDRVGDDMTFHVLLAERADELQ
jgi:isopentenyl phosphate kinase